MINYTKEYGIGYVKGDGQKFILAFKKEGAEYDTGHLKPTNSNNIKNEIDELRKEGYKIFLLLNNFYTVDDIYANAIEQHEEFIGSEYHQKHGSGGNSMYSCGICGTDTIWQNDYSFEDFGKDGDGMVSIYKCPDCPTTIEEYHSFDEGGEE